MKERIYLKIGKARKGTRVSVTSRIPSFEPLYTGSGRNKNYCPTVLIALDLEIPDKEFDKVKVLLEAKIETGKPCVEIRQVELENE